MGWFKDAVERGKEAGRREAEANAAKPGTLFVGATKGGFKSVYTDKSGRRHESFATSEQGAFEAGVQEMVLRDGRMQPR